MRMSKQLENCIRFANFAKEHKIEPYHLGEMIQVAIKRHSHWVRMNNNNQWDDKNKKKDERLMAQFKELAKQAGFRAQFHALSPTLYKGKSPIAYHLPSPY